MRLTTIKSILKILYEKKYFYIIGFNGKNKEDIYEVTYSFNFPFKINDKYVQKIVENTMDEISFIDAIKNGA